MEDCSKKDNIKFGWTRKSGVTKRNLYSTVEVMRLYDDDYDDHNII